MSKLQVKKANFLVPLEESVSKPAQLLASYLVASLPNTVVESETLPKLRFSYSELRNAINADGRQRVNKVKDIMELGVELQRCVLFYEDNVSERTVTWLIEQERTKKDNVFTYSLHPGLRKYLINLEKHFTRYNYLFRVCLNAHAMKMYEILKMYQYLGQVTLHIEDDLKPSLGLSGKYAKIYEFKRRVLTVAQNEIEKYTDIRFEYEEAEKVGKTPTALTFYIYPNQPTDLPPKLLNKLRKEGSIANQNFDLPLPIGKETQILPEQHDIYMVLRKYGGKDGAIAGIIEVYGTEKVRYQIKHLERVSSSGKQKVLAPFAWLCKALKEDYQDMVQDMKLHRKTKSSKVDAQVNEVAEAQKVLKKKEGEFFRKKSEICDVLISKKPEILHKTVENMRGALVLRTAFQNDKTPEEMYSDTWMKGAIQAKIQKQHPEVFEKAEKEYSKIITKLRKKAGL